MSSILRVPMRGGRRPNDVAAANRIDPLMPVRAIESKHTKTSEAMASSFEHRDFLTLENLDPNQSRIP